MATTTDWLRSNTDHGLLVAFGEFLQQHGLIKKLMQVPIAQKTVHFAPGTKLVEFLAGINVLCSSPSGCSRLRRGTG